MKLAAALLTGASLLGVPALAAAGTVTNEMHGVRNVRIYTPTTPLSPAPLVVMLHGCTQTPDLFADATQMDAIAEKEGFVVAYPEEPSSSNATLCFQWYDPAHQSRGAGEPKDLSDATNEIIAAHGLDPERVYAAGISAGAAMTVILGATYPDVYAAIGVVAGLEYQAASSVNGGLVAAESGGPDPVAAGMAAHTAMGPFAHPIPVMSFQGTADSVVNKVNGDQVVAQWRETNLEILGAGSIADPVSSAGSAGYAFTHYVHSANSNGASVIEQYVVDGLNHAWPGGKAGGSYSDPLGPDASTLLWAFFAGRTRSAPLDVPPVSLADGGVPGPGGASSSGGAASDSGLSSDGGTGAAEATSDGGGCTTAPAASPAAGASALACVFLALSFARRRRQ